MRPPLAWAPLEGIAVSYGMLSDLLTSFNNCFLQVQLDNLPGMSLVAGKALSSARMSDAVLSQSSLMGSQQFQDGENEGKGHYAWGRYPKGVSRGAPLPSSPVTAPLLYEEPMGSHSIPVGFWTPPFPSSPALSERARRSPAPDSTGPSVYCLYACSDAPSVTLVLVLRRRHRVLMSASR